MTPKKMTKVKIALYDELVRDPRSGAIDLRVAWLLLFKYLNSESEIAWPSAETMAKELSVAVRSVRYSIQRLTGPNSYFTIVQGGGRGHSNRYTPNFQTVQATSPFEEETVQPSSPISGERVQPSSVKGAISRPERVQSSSPEPLEESIEEPLEKARAARSATPDGDARAASLKTKKVCSAMEQARLESALYYRRQELESSGGLRHAMLSDLEREAADEWLRAHGEIGAKQGAVNGHLHAGL